MSSTLYGRALVIFRVSSSVMSPESMTELFGVPPDSITLTGAMRSPPRLMPKKNLWCLQDTADGVADLSALISLICGRAVSIETEIRKARKIDPDMDVYMHIAVEEWSELPAIYLSSANLQILAALGADVGVSV